MCGSSSYLLSVLLYYSSLYIRCYKKWLHMKKEKDGPTVVPEHVLQVFHSLSQVPNRQQDITVVLEILSPYGTLLPSWFPDLSICMAGQVVGSQFRPKAVT